MNNDTKDINDLTSKELLEVAYKLKMLGYLLFQASLKKADLSSEKREESMCWNSEEN